MNSFASCSDSSALSEIGNRIKALRISMSKTQCEFASECGLSESTLKRIECGQDTKFSNIIKILRHTQLIANMDLLIPQKEPDYKSLFANQKERKRASKKKSSEKEWKWGDEE